MNSTALDREALEAVVWLAIRTCRPQGESWRVAMREIADRVVAFDVARGTEAPRWFTFGPDVTNRSTRASSRRLANSSVSTGRTGSGERNVSLKPSGSRSGAERTDPLR
jgi:hypothetical protein